MLLSSICSLMHCFHCTLYIKCLVQLKSLLPLSLLLLYFTHLAHVCLFLFLSIFFFFFSDSPSVFFLSIFSCIVFSLLIYFLFRSVSTHLSLFFGQTRTAGDHRDCKLLQNRSQVRKGHGQSIPKKKNHSLYSLSASLRSHPPMQYAYCRLFFVHRAVM